MIDPRGLRETRKRLELVKQLATGRCGDSLTGSEVYGLVRRWAMNFVQIEAGTS